MTDSRPEDEALFQAFDPPPPFGLLLRRALALNCVVCGRGRPYATLFRMHPHCPQCRFRYERDPGYFLGSIYVNYGLTGIIVLAAALLLAFFPELNAPRYLVLISGFAIIFPLWFFRYSRQIWLAIDLACDPPRVGADAVLNHEEKSPGKQRPEDGR